MTWTRVMPEAPGLYWVRGKHGGEVTIVQRDGPNWWEHLGDEQICKDAYMREHYEWWDEPIMPPSFAHVLPMDQDADCTES